MLMTLIHLIRFSHRPAWTKWYPVRSGVFFQARVCEICGWTEERML